MHAPSLHHTLKAFAFAIRPCVHVLALHKPISVYLFPNRQQSSMISHSKFVQVPFRAYSLYREMPKHRFRDILRRLPATSHTYCIVAMLLAGFVADYLNSIELQDCTRCTFASLCVVDSSHPLFDGQGTGPQR